MTPEGRVKKRVDDLLKQHGAYRHKPVQNGMGEPALDYHACHRGLYFGVETKAPGKQPTARQIATARRILAAGGMVFLIDGDLSELEKWLANPPGVALSTWAVILLSRADLAEDSQRIL